MSNKICEKIYFDEISPFIDGEYTGRSADEIIGHLKSCAKCRKKYESLINLKNIISSLAEYALSEEEKANLTAMIPSAFRSVRQKSRSVWPRNLTITLASAASFTIIMLAAVVVFRFFFLSTTPTVITSSAPAAVESDAANEVAKTELEQETMRADVPTGETAGELMTAETVDFPVFINEENFYNTANFKEAKNIIETAEKLSQKVGSDGSITQQELISKLKDSLASAQLNSDLIPDIFKKNIERIANSNKDEIVISESTENLLPFYAEKATYEGDNSLIIAYFLKPQKDLNYRYLLVPVANSINTGNIQDIITIKK